MTQATEANIAAFTKQVQTLVTTQMTRQGYKSSHTISYTMGKKFARIITSPHPDQRSVWCFVDLSNGNVMKAASWAKPALHARGNIFAEDPTLYCSWTGPASLRR